MLYYSFLRPSHFIVYLQEVLKDVMLYKLESRLQLVYLVEAFLVLCSSILDCRRLDCQWLRRRLKRMQVLSSDPRLLFRINLSDLSKSRLLSYENEHPLDLDAKKNKHPLDDDTIICLRCVALLSIPC